MQKECLALQRRQRLERRGEARQALARLRVVGRIGRPAFVLVALKGNERQAALSPVVDEIVVRDGVEPCGEFRLRRITRSRLDHAHPDLLEELLAERAVFYAA